MCAGSILFTTQRHKGCYITEGHTDRHTISKRALDRRPIRQTESECTASPPDSVRSHAPRPVPVVSPPPLLLQIPPSPLHPPSSDATRRHRRDDPPPDGGADWADSSPNSRPARSTDCGADATRDGGGSGDDDVGGNGDDRLDGRLSLLSSTAQPWSHPTPSSQPPPSVVVAAQPAPPPALASHLPPATVSAVILAVPASAQGLTPGVLQGSKARPKPHGSATGPTRSDEVRRSGMPVTMPCRPLPPASPAPSPPLLSRPGGPPGQ